MEVYPLCLKLTDSRDNSQSVIKISKKVLKLVLTFLLMKYNFIGFHNLAGFPFQDVVVKV